MSSARQIGIAVMAAAAALLAAAPASAQERTPRIGYVYPAGGRQGSEFQVALGGRLMQGYTGVHISGPGVRAVVVEHQHPLPGREANALREELGKLREKIRGPRSATAAATRPQVTETDRQRAQEIARLLDESRKRMLNPAIAETMIVKVTLAPDAAPGRREVRLMTDHGLSNPMTFYVDSLAETRETAPDPDENLPGPLREARRARRNAQRGGAEAQEPLDVALPVIINGQIMPGDVDRYRFDARKGQRIVAAVAARDLIPYLADAVPGWFQAALAIYDASGKELSYADRMKYQIDPVVMCEIPADGQYVVEIKDALYRGREDFVYRLTVGELPYITGVFPLGGKAGIATAVELSGWNLPTKTLSPRFEEAATHSLTVPNASNAVPFAVDTLEESLEREPNNTMSAAQALTPPVIVNGRIDRPGDWDVFRFHGRSGSRIVAQVQARKLNSPLDAVLRLTDGTGKQLAISDDCEDKAAGRSTHHADPTIAFTLPEDGTYFLHLGDTAGAGGPGYTYRLRVSPPRPDFVLRLAPSAISLRRGQTVALTVQAVRIDDYSGPIDLSLKDAPEGFVLSGGRIAPGADRATMTLTAPVKIPAEMMPLRIEGSAMINRRAVVRPALPAEDMMQAFAYRHMVRALELYADVVARGGQSRGPIKLIGELPVPIASGGQGSVTVGYNSISNSGTITMELVDPPAGVSIRKIAPAGANTEITFAADATKIKAPLEGNLIVEAFMVRVPDKNKPQNVQRYSLGLLPAIPFKILGAVSTN
ncbi:MAG: PPC domain-containing protein [Planctomycetaceae bacterium]|nr:PPC domain-containing protein [Planctomycetaceae bacterium]